MNADTKGWTPILSADGMYYCSPRCGGGKFCRKVDYDAAVRAAGALAERMGEGWEPVVWENLGWHYRIEHKGKCAKIYAHEDRRDARRPEGGYPVRSYSAWIEPGMAIRSQAIQFIQDGETPEDALGFATQEARTMMAKTNDALKEILA